VDPPVRHAFWESDVLSIFEGSSESNSEGAGHVTPDGLRVLGDSELLSFPVRFPTNNIAIIACFFPVRQEF
jgi:hypothetical protein